MASSSPDLRYSPQTNSAIRRSKYLEDALAQLQEAGSRPITGGLGQVAAQLGAAYLTKRGKDKADSALAEALAKEAEGRKASILAPFGLGGGLTDQGVQPAPQGPLSPQTGAPQAPSPIAAAMMPPQAQASPAGQVTPQKPQGGSIIDALMPGLIKRESGGRPRPGPMTPYGQAQGQTQMLDATAESMAKKIGVPWRPDMMRGTSPEAMQYQETLGRAYLQEGLEATGNPRDALRYYHGGPDRSIWGPKTNAYADAILAGIPEAQLIGGPAPQGQMQVSGSMAEAQAPAPQMNMNMGFPPMPQSPQPPAGGPPAPQGAPAQSLPGGAGAWGPAPGEIAYLQQLASSPRTIDAAEAYANELRKKYASPPKMETYSVNGVPQAFNPYAVQAGPLPIPQGAMNQTVGAQQLGIQAPAGTAYSVDPFGKPSQVYAPPTGQQVVSAPGQAYREAPVSGGSQDISGNPRARWEALQGVRAEIKPVLDSAIALRRNYSALEAGYRQQSGPGDLAMINGLQKMIDEGVVREGDVALQLKAQGLAGGIAGVQSYLQSSGTFSPEIRSKIKAAGDDIYSNINQTYRQRAEGYRGMVDRTFGEGAFNDVLPPETVGALGWSGADPQGAQGGQQAPQGGQAATPPQPRVPPGREDLEREMRRRGLIR